MIKSIHTWEEASKLLPMLTFDLGQSPKEIKHQFSLGHYLKYNTLRNYYTWYSRPPVQALSQELINAMNQFDHYYPDKDCTCTKCDLVMYCPVAFDVYNVDGDCLANK